MALIGNHSVLNKSCAKFFSGTATAGAYAGNNRSNFKKISHLRSRDIYWPKKVSLPYGYNVGEAFIISVSSGGLSSFTNISGVGDLSGSGKSVRLSISSMSGTGTISTANLALLVPSTAALSGTGSLVAALTAASGAIASLSGTGTISASLKATIPITASLSGSGSVSANLKGYGSLEADITPFTELSPQSLASAVLAGEIEDGYDLQASLRLILSALAGELSGAPGTTITIQNVNGDKDRIVATVDSNGNRTSLTYDVSDS